MNDAKKIKPTPQLLLGIAALILGVILLLENLDIFRFSVPFAYWPVALILFGVYKFAQARQLPGYFLGFTFASIGILLLMDNFRIINFDLGHLWPLLLIFGGGAIVWQALAREENVHPTEARNTVSALAFMSGIERTCNSMDFDGGELSAVMGGCELDLRRAAMKNPRATLNTFAFWGGIEIKVPETWVVESRGIPFLGGFSDTTQAPPGPPEGTLVVRGLAIMGAVEIRN